MTLLLISASWTFILLLITGLCAAARLGDRDQRRHASRAAGTATARPTSITVHVSPGPVRRSETGATRAGVGSLAA